MYLGHEAVVISEAVDLGLSVQSPHCCHMHVAPHKAHANVLGLGQVLQPGNEVVPLPVMLTYTHITSAVLPRDGWRNTLEKGKA